MTVKTKRSVLLLEPLEGRTLFCGDVTAILQNGSLMISGDSGDNQVVISSPAAGVTTITGRDNTTVNGQAEISLAAISGTPLLLASRSRST